MKFNHKEFDIGWFYALSSWLGHHDPQWVRYRICKHKETGTIMYLIPEHLASDYNWPIPESIKEQAERLPRFSGKRYRATWHPLYKRITIPDLVPGYVAHKSQRLVRDHGTTWCWNPENPQGFHDNLEKTWPATDEELQSDEWKLFCSMAEDYWNSPESKRCKVRYV